MGSKPVVALQGAGVRYGERWALKDLDLTVQTGERVALVGPSGAGKTTVLGLINGTVSATAGSVSLFGRAVKGLDPHELQGLRRRAGTVFQGLDLVGPLRVVHNVNAGAISRWSLAKAAWSLLRPARVGEVERALGAVGMAGRLYERTDRLSGGEQQRVAIARVLVQNPDLVLADEPIASLDPASAAEIMGLLAGLGKTLVASLHDFEAARSHCDRMVGIRSGTVLFDCPAAAVTDAMAAQLYEAEEAAQAR